LVTASKRSVVGGEKGISLLCISGDNHDFNPNVSGCAEEREFVLVNCRASNSQG
jgi:hypothetical protein